MASPKPLPSDLEEFRQSYADLFGEMPPLPAAKFAFSPDVDPQALRLSEEARAHAFESDVFDRKTTQLVLFGMLLSQGVPAAKEHARAAIRAGATWEELHKIVELASVSRALGPFNQGAAFLEQLRDGTKSD